MPGSRRGPRSALSAGGRGGRRPPAVAEPGGGERCRVPDGVLDLVCQEVFGAVGTPEGVLGVWGGGGQLLPRALGILRPCRARALVSSPDTVPAALFSTPGLHV